MILAASYPLLNIIWTMLVFFAFVVWIMTLFAIFADLFRRRDVSGWGKAGWTLLVIVLPFLGVLIYLVVQGGNMAERREEDARASQQQMDDYVRRAAGSGDAAAEISRAKELLDSGAITPAEFEQIKQRALGGGAQVPTAAAG